MADIGTPTALLERRHKDNRDLYGMVEEELPWLFSRSVNTHELLITPLMQTNDCHTLSEEQREMQIGRLFFDFGVDVTFTGTRQPGESNV